MDDQLAARIAAPCRVDDPLDGITREEHQWWHACGVTRHLVCTGCGMGLHYLTPEEMAAIPHSTLRNTHGYHVELVPCTGPEVAW